MAEIYTKPNTTSHADALICEAEGLTSLRQALDRAADDYIGVPRVYRVDESALEMTAIRSQPASAKTLRMLGEGLARMHQSAMPRYGWSGSNYLGLSPQVNRWDDHWGEFFVRDRLGFQVSKIKDTAVRERFKRVLGHHAEGLAHWLDRQCQHASLVHGDLWQGNALFDSQRPWLIDPAVYCGDREVDLAMTEMFGGFGAGFYAAYDEVYPRTQAYPEKRTIYNLYHYLNHYNLFGDGYLQGCEQAMAAIPGIIGTAR